MATLADATPVEGEGAADARRVSASIGRREVPTLTNGPARIVITASRPVFFGLRTATASVTHDVEVRLDPPRVAVLSLHHYVNLGGAEFVVLRATPPDASAGIRVGDVEYPAYPGSAVGLADPALRVAFFALRHDQDLNATVSAFARDAAGNQATTPVDHRSFEKRFVQSRIGIDQGFLDRVVPAIAAETPDLKIDTSTPEGRLEGSHHQRHPPPCQRCLHPPLAARSRPEMLGPRPSPSSATPRSSRAADRRTYFFGDREIDRQVHLGLTRLGAAGPVLAANTGIVVADFLDHGNCVVLDHGPACSRCMPTSTLG